MTSNAQLIFNKLISQYPEGLKEITALSFNKTGNKNFVICSEKGFDYDLVTNCSSAYQEHHKEKSPDALFCINDKLYFVEFKEGKHEKADIRLKIHEGITTLYMFTRRYLPDVEKEDFLKLDINYAVIARHNPNSTSSFQTALLEASKKYQLKNIEGFLVNQTRYTTQPSLILKLIKTVTSNQITHIDIDDGLGGVQRFS